MIGFNLFTALIFTGVCRFGVASGRSQLLSEQTDALAFRQRNAIGHRLRRASCQVECRSVLNSVEDLDLCLPGSQTFMIGEYHKFVLTYSIKEATVGVLFNGSPQLPTGVELKHTDCRVTVVFPSLSECHNGYYSFKVSHGSTVQTKTLHLKVLYFGISSLVLKTTGWTNNTLPIGGSGTMTCSLSSGLPIKVEFFRENLHGSPEKIKNHTNGFQIVDKSRSSYVFQLQIRNVSSYHSGQYRCVVTSKSGCVSRNTSIVLKTVECPRGHYCRRNSSQSTPCPAGTYNSQPGRFGDCLSCPTGHYCPPESVSPLSCGNVSYGDIDSVPSTQAPRLAGHASDCRRCPLFQSCSQDNKCRFVCTHRQSRVAKTGRQVDISCHFSNFGLVKSFNWFKENTILKNCSDYAIVTNSRWSTLVLRKGRHSDSGNYFCRGQDNYMGATFEERFTVSFSKPKTSRNFVIGVAIGVLLVAIGTVAAHQIHRKARLARKQAKLQAFKKMQDGVSDAFDASGVVREFAEKECVNQLGNSMPQSEPIHDVFVCYSSVDREWVRKTLLEQLDIHQISTYVDFKDFTPGDSIAQNIVDAIEQSRNVIAVLSPDFLESGFCKTELEVALERKHGDCIIPIVFRKCDVPEPLKDKTYLDWGHCDVKPYFWEQLLTALRWTPRT